MKMRRLFLMALALLAACVLSPVLAEDAVFQPADLPVIYLQIDGGQEEITRMNTSDDHSYRCTGTMDIIVPEGYSGDFEGRYPQASVRGLRMKYIRGRGNGTWGMPKLPYKIKLEEKQDLFGMGKSKTWVLQANYYDNSMIRNRLTEWLGEQMGLEYTPQGVFVEVVMNGEYLGCYTLSEQVQIGSHRVAIDELKENDRELPDIQGGYLLEFNPDDVEGPDAFETAHGLALGNREPSFNTADDGWRNDAQMNYIRDYVQRADDAVFAESGTEYEDYLDMQSLADYWWIMEFAANEDAFGTDSAHMFKKRFEADGSEGKLHFGPLWDFDESWGNAMEETIQVIGFNNTTFIWTDALRKKPEFRELLAERWRVMDGKLEEIVREGGVLDQLAALVTHAWQRDYDRWLPPRQEMEMVPKRDLEGEIGHIRQWASLRRQWISENMDRLGILEFTMTVRGEGVEERQYTFACDTWVDLYYVEEAASGGRAVTAWVKDDGTLLEDFVVMDRDMTLTMRFEEAAP